MRAFMLEKASCMKLKHRAVYEIKTTPPIKKGFCSTILFGNSVYKFSEMYLSYTLNLTPNK